MIVNETSSTSSEFYFYFNRMKNYITNNFVYIKPKEKKKYNLDNYINFIIFSNYADTIMLERTNR
jgi:hypothetical protein